MKKIILLFFLNASLLQAQNSQIKDVIIGDSITGFYNNIEFSPDGKFMAWQEPNPATGYFRTYICSMNLDNGEMQPWHGRGYFAGINKNSVCYPGRDSIGNFFVFLDTLGLPVVARPIDSISGTTQTINIGVNKRRVPFYPTWNPNSGEIIYFFQEPNTSNVNQLFYANLTNYTGNNQITNNYDIQINNATTPIPYPKAALYQGVVPFTSTYYTGPRWFYGDNRLTFGKFNSLTDNTIELWEMDFNKTANPTPVKVSNENFMHCDDFPFYFKKERYVAGGINLLNKIGLHKWNGTIYANILQKTYSDSRLSYPIAATSLEPFTYNEKSYTAVFMFDTICPKQGPLGCLGNSEAEIWLQSFLNENGQIDTSLSIIVNADEPLIRADPEYLIGNNKVWIYYYGKKANETRMKLHRCETPLVKNINTAIEENAVKMQVNIFPNPFTTAINIQPENQNFIYHLSNIMGQTLYTGQSIHQQDFSNLHAGIYILQILDGQKIIRTEKIIKQ